MNSCVRTEPDSLSSKDRTYAVQTLQTCRFAMNNYMTPKALSRNQYYDWVRNSSLFRRTVFIFRSLSHNAPFEKRNKIFPHISESTWFVSEISEPHDALDVNGTKCYFKELLKELMSIVRTLFRWPRVEFTLHMILQIRAFTYPFLAVYF